MSTKPTPTPVYLKFSELVVDPILSGRSKKEITENAKSLAKEMEAFGEWDAMQPGQVFTGEDGKLHLCAGFTRLAAATALGYKGGYFFEIPKADPLDIRLKCITTNGGKPVSRLEQGKLFSVLKEGLVADDFAGAVADPKNPKDWKMQPMTDAEIADKIGKSGEHVRQCVMITEIENEELREMLDSDAISTNSIVVAMGWAKQNENLALRIIKRAQREAGNDRVTKKHLDAIKGEFTTLKAVPAKKTDAASSEAGSDAGNGTHGEDVGANDNSGGIESGELESVNIETELPFQTESQPKPISKTTQKTIRATLLTVILETDSEIDDDLANRLADRLIDAKLIVIETPF